jgi:hypothetical protein
VLGLPGGQWAAAKPGEPNTVIGPPLQKAKSPPSTRGDKEVPRGVGAELTLALLLCSQWLDWPTDYTAVKPSWSKTASTANATDIAVRVFIWITGAIEVAEPMSAIASP